MSDDLVARLHAAARDEARHGVIDSPEQSYYSEAADRIEALEFGLAEERANADMLAASLKTSSIQWEVTRHPTDIRASRDARAMALAVHHARRSGETT